MSGATCEMSCEPTPLLEWELQAGNAARECKAENQAAPKQSVPATIADPLTAGGFQSHGRARLRAAQQLRRASQEATAACGTRASLQSEWVV